MIQTVFWAPVSSLIICDVKLAAGGGTGMNGALHAQKIVSAPDVMEAWAKQGAVPMRMSPEEFGKFIEQDIQKWAKVVKFSGAQVD